MAQRLAQRGSDYWTTEDTPFIDKDMLFRGLGSMARGLFVPREADLQRFPRFVTDPRVGIRPPSNLRMSKKKQELAAKDVERGAKAAASLIPLAPGMVDERTEEMRRIMALQAQDAARVPFVQPLQGVPPGLVSQAMPIDPGVEARTEEMRKAMALEQQDARYIAAANAALGPPAAGRAGQVALGGANTGLPVDPRVEEMRKVMALEQQDAANPAFTPGPPPAGQAGIAALMGANTGIPVMPRDTLTGQTALSGANTGIPYDPNALSNRLYNYVAGRDEEGGSTPLGQDLTGAGDAAQGWLDNAVTKSGDKLEHYFTPRGPYGTGGTPAGEDLSWAGDKVQQFMDYMGTIPVPGILSDPVGTIGGAISKGGKGGKDDAAPITDPAILFPEEELPAEDGGAGGGTGGGTGGGKDTAGGETDTLDAALQKYLTETDTSYDDALSTINKAYGDLTPDHSNPQQEQADAFAAREGERTAALAQLALAGGLVKSAGKSWEGAGQGFIDAAGVYDKGFERYHNTLIKSAELHETRRRDDRAFEIAKRDAAISMWQTGRTDYRAAIKELMTQRREDVKADRTERKDARKDQLSYIDSVFKSRIETKYPKESAMEMDDAGHAALNKEYEMWALSRRMGRPLSEQEYEYIKAKAAAEAANKPIEVDVSGD